MKAQAAILHQQAVRVESVVWVEGVVTDRIVMDPVLWLGPIQAQLFYPLPTEKEVTGAEAENVVTPAGEAEEVVPAQAAAAVTVTVITLLSPEEVAVLLL